MEYGIVDKNGRLWFDDFEFKVDADIEAEVINAGDHLVFKDLKPFNVIAVGKRKAGEE